MDVRSRIAQIASLTPVLLLLFQGKVLFNSKPAEDIEVTLCEKFNQFLGGCNGGKFVARTDKDGEYVIADVPPKTYEADDESFQERSENSKPKSRRKSKYG